MKKTSLFYSSSVGFTLIELLIVVSIIILMVGGGIASFINFNEKQQVLNGGKELQEYLRMAQTLVRVGDTPDGCGKLSGYEVISADTGIAKEIKLIAVCSNGDIQRKSFFLPESTTLSSDIDITFHGLHGGVTGATSIEVIGNSGRTYAFEVTQGGEITQGEVLQ